MLGRRVRPGATGLTTQVGQAAHGADQIAYLRGEDLGSVDTVFDQSLTLTIHIIQACRTICVDGVA